MNKEYEKTILLIMNCKKYYKKAIYQKMTWLKNISPIQYYHVIGNDKLEEEFRFDNIERILWIKVADDYNSLPKKVIKAYEAVKKTFMFDFIFKTDDDQILVKPLFLNTLNNLLDKNVSHYGGYIVDVKENYLSQYNKIHTELPNNLIVFKTKYCSGRFYFLSEYAIADLLEKKNKIYNEYLEDYAIGFHLDSKYKTNIMKLQTNNYFTDIELSDFPNIK
jgi:hypothetical protein